MNKVTRLLTVALSVALVLMMALLTQPVLAQDIMKVSFPPGANGTSLAGRIRGYEDVTYVLRARAGQQLRVVMTATNASAYFNVTAPGAPEAMFIGSTSGSTMTGVLPVSGDYKVVVYLMRNAARRDEVANYTLSLRITGASAGGTGSGGGDFADGDAGGPDFWRVTGLVPGDTLNLRAGPSSAESILARLAMGTVVRNLGCSRVSGQRWCQVESRGRRGWVAGRFLTEAANPSDTGTQLPTVQPPVKPRPPANGVQGNGEPFSATGNIPCSLRLGQPTGQCAFGVLRPLRGEANLWIAMGNGRERYILFQRGVPAFTDAQADISYTKEGDLFLVRIGVERYEIPEAVLTGG